MTRIYFIEFLCERWMSCQALWHPYCVYLQPRDAEHCNTKKCVHLWNNYLYIIILWCTIMYTHTNSISPTYILFLYSLILLPRTDRDFALFITVFANERFEPLFRFAKKHKKRKNNWTHSEQFGCSKNSDINEYFNLLFKMRTLFVVI